RIAEFDPDGPADTESVGWPGGVEALKEGVATLGELTAAVPDSRKPTALPLVSTHYSFSRNAEEKRPRIARMNTNKKERILLFVFIRAIRRLLLLAWHLFADRVPKQKLTGVDTNGAAVFPPQRGGLSRGFDPISGTRRAH